MASGGYPEKYATGYPVSGLEQVSDALIFHAGTKLITDGGQQTIVTAGGRVLGIVAVADELQSALERAYRAVAQIDFKDAHYRRDIGRRAADSAP
jgi:phosphoribosylamine--glycine ligase